MQTPPPVPPSPPPEPQVLSVDKIRRYPCPECGAQLLFEPKEGLLKCTHCQHTERIPDSADEVQERSYEIYLRPRESQLQVFAEGVLEVACSSCGAVVTFTPPEVALKCTFCGASIVAQPKIADPLLAPEAVLPFGISKRDATDAMKKWISGLWFAPNDLKQFATPQGIDGIYLPFWTYDAHTVTHYSGQRGEYYYVTETYWTTDANGNKVQQTRQVQHTRWYPASGTVTRWFDDILVAASNSLSRNRLDDLEPWDLHALKSYEPAYLSGYKAQKYQVDLAAGFEIAKQTAEPAIRADVYSDIGGDTQNIFSVTTHYSGITFKHTLLPVYAGAYRLGQKVFQVVINGRTGEVQGERPYSVWKIAFAVLLAAIVLYFLFSMLGSNH